MKLQIKNAGSGNYLRFLLFLPEFYQFENVCTEVARFFLKCKCEFLMPFCLQSFFFCIYFQFKHKRSSFLIRIFQYPAQPPERSNKIFTYFGNIVFEQKQLK